MDRSAISSRIGQWIEGHKAESSALASELVRIPSVNHPPYGNEAAYQDFFAERLRSLGAAVSMYKLDSVPGLTEHPAYMKGRDYTNRPNVHGQFTGSGGGRSIVFSGHADTVYEGTEPWQDGPFAGTIRDGKLYGRGTCDMKGGLAASIIAAEAFVDVYPDFSGAVEISGTADEETGGFGGVAYLAEKGFFTPERVQHVIIPEPLNKDRICLGHRGVWWAEIETKGTIAHGSMPFLGDSAIRHMGAVLTEMEATLFPALAEKRTAMPVVPPQARQSTLNINSIHGGQPEPEEGFTGFPAPVVAHSSRMIIDRRYLIEETPADVRQEMIDVLERVKAQRPTFQYEIRDLWTISPTMTERDAPIVTATSKAITEVLGIDPAYVVSPGTYDQKHIDRIGRMKNCIAYGPGILDLAHKPDEYVGVDDMIDSAKVMALTLRDLLGPR